ncbi:2-Methylisocitrate lyase, PEP mutase family [Variovorax sp. YR750]|uniref:isocitrate lyase/PEP mutase family protein n=1 Tax=Variovorax sp. YR750 TaxID=1884384 RepID=UPI0008D68BEA|nr:isocitrate lyase/phosphoenolpyruvate mutase family protein [Variovorax sp. YR750]SEL23824.1 2-Methylisocitrate lyase, PEP mutase family [Variovorax sp. YR750]
MDQKTRAARGRAFLELHRAGGGFVMPNAWDPGSAVLLASEGFKAIGTTSAGIAFSLGRPDYNVRDARLSVGREEMLEVVRKIAAAVDIPVNADLEAGYGDEPADVADTIRMAIEAGAAGGNIEDTDAARGRLFDEKPAVDRIAAARGAIDAAGGGFVLNARTDAFQFRFPGDDALGIAIRRANRFIEAGADCVFVPGVTDPALVRTLAREIAGPLNIVVGLNEATAGAFELIEAGAVRISVGGSIARSVMALVRRSAQELHALGTVSYARSQIPQRELNALFEAALRTRANAGLSSTARSTAP